MSAVGWFGAVQAQDFTASLWGVGQRCADATEAGLRAAFDAGELVRTHVLRPTWHLVAPADLRWMQQLTGDRVLASMGTYLRRTELDAATLARCGDLICAALGGGRHLTRQELRDVLAADGIDASDTVRFSLIAMWCELQALICSGTMRGRQHTYALVDERLAAAPARERDEALGELAQRYFASHGPAQDADFAWWSGLTLSEARRATDIAGYPDRAERAAGSVPGLSPTVHLLPNYDEYVVAYRDRSALFASAEVPRELAGMGVLVAPVIVYRGQFAGRWKRSIERRRVVLRADLNRDLGTAGQRALAAAAARYGRFLDLPVDVVSGRIEP